MGVEINSLDCTMAHDPATCSTCNRFAQPKRGWVEHAEDTAALGMLEMTLRLIAGLVRAAMEALF